ncbi:MAG: acyl-CoA dehydrogenase family protein [Caulobacter sp.]
MPVSRPVPSDSDPDTVFLGEVRAFLAEALTPDLREAGRRTLGVHSDIEACRLWHQRLHRRGWIAPGWPVAHGGTGWTPRQRFLFDRECALNDAPVLFAGGIRSLGPLIIEMGTPLQQARYLPAILSGDDLWAQGFSEPGAGSDLARVATRAARTGDRYVVDGSKIWTTGAHLANRMFALVRTATEDRPQKGLTFLLIDMASPGLTVSPIITIDGEHELNAVFFDQVGVPVANRIGEEGQGWAVAKRLMQLARSNNTPAALVRRVYQRARAAARATPDLEPGLSARLVAAEIELTAFEQTELALLPGGRLREGDNTSSSVLKLIGSELHQRVAELAMEIAGLSRGIALDPFRDEAGWLADGARAMAKHFATRAASIYSGSSETQRNVIAQALPAGIR